MNRQEITQNIQNIYAERRDLARARARVQEQEYLTMHPDYAVLQTRLQDLRWEKLERLSKKQAGHTDLDKLDQEIQALETQAEKQASLIGSRPEPEFACPLCRDTGKTPKGEICPNCYPATLRQVLAANEVSILPDPDQNFAHFCQDLFSEDPLDFHGKKISPRQQMQENTRVAGNFAESLSCGQTPELANLYFVGAPGTGKTFLANCVANELLDAGLIAINSSMLQFEEVISRYRTLQKSFGAKTADLAKAEADYRLLLEADLLVLDDFGVIAKILTEPLAELLMVLQQRKAGKKATIITSNLNLRELRIYYDERLLSRILERFTILPFLGQDLRHRRSIN